MLPTQLFALLLSSDNLVLLGKKSYFFLSYLVTLLAFWVRFSFVWSAGEVYEVRLTKEVVQFLDSMYCAGFFIKRVERTHHNRKQGPTTSDIPSALPPIDTLPTASPAIQ